MLRTTLIAVAAFLSADIGTSATGAPTPLFESPSAPTAQSKIDDLVLARLRLLGIPPANLCSDAVFVRRVYLDVIGTLPTAPEARQFLLDRSPDKRRALIDRVLEREEFADYWAMKWCDLLRVKAEFPINLWPNAVQGYHRWVRTSLKENVPYDRLVREMLTASGSNFRVPEVNFYRAMQNKDPRGIAQAVALTFMGTRAEKWPKERLDSMAAFFAQVGYKQTGEWKEEIVFWDPDKAKDALRTAVFPDGTPLQKSAKRDGPKPTIEAASSPHSALRIPHSEALDPREAFAGWLIDPANPWFTRNIVNRVWSWLLGRGIIHEPDDIRPDNPPQNPELLSFLENELVASKYDLKRIYRLILNSRTYQLASIPGSTKPEAEANFAYYPLRRLEAEVLIDALNQVSGTTERYSSAIPEPFTFIPEEQRSIALADGSITSSFLEMFGRPPRDTGLESERNNRPTAAQSLHLLNSSHIQRKLEQGRRLQFVMQSKASPREIVTGLYLMILSRFPTEAELRAVAEYSQSGNVTAREATMDLVWALINSAEFLYRH